MPNLACTHDPRWTRLTVYDLHARVVGMRRLTIPRQLWHARGLGKLDLLVQAQPLFANDQNEVVHRCGNYLQCGVFTQWCREIKASYDRSKRRSAYGL